MEYVWIGIGGFLGANARYGLSRFVADRLGGGFPYGTFLVNISGSLAIGVILIVLTERVVTDPAWRLLVVVGFLGGYTTFSSYTFEALTLMERGDWARAAAYVLGSNAIGLLACAIGMAVARSLSR